MKKILYKCAYCGGNVEKVKGMFCCENCLLIPKDKANRRPAVSGKGK